MISRKPKLRRQKKLFKQKGKVLRPDQMNLNVAAWGRLIKNKNLQESSISSSTGATDNSASSNSVIQRRFSDEQATCPTAVSIGPNTPLSAQNSSGSESSKAFPLTPLSAQASLSSGMYMLLSIWELNLFCLGFLELCNVLPSGF